MCDPRRQAARLREVERAVRAVKMPGGGSVAAHEFGSLTAYDGVIGRLWRDDDGALRQVGRDRHALHKQARYLLSQFLRNVSNVTNDLRT